VSLSVKAGFIARPVSVPFYIQVGIVVTAALIDLHVRQAERRVAKAF